MNNERYGVPQHELNVISSMLRDRAVAARQLVNWNSSPPQYWLLPKHFQTPWAGEIYETLINGGLDAIDQRLQAYPNADTAHVTADAVTRQLYTKYQQMAAAGIPHARETLASSDYWAGMHSALRDLASTTWPANTSGARHDAYVAVRSSQHPSTTEGVPFTLARGRTDDAAAREKEVAVIGAILSDPSRAAKFRYQPSSPDASPYWLQPQDFGDPATAEIWDALVTGPDPAIALPAATDPNLTAEQRAQAMIEHIYQRLSYNDYHRSTADPQAQSRLQNNTNQAIAQYLARATRADFCPNQDHADQYALRFILEPSIPATVQELAGEVRRTGLSDAPLGQIAMELSTRQHTLDQLKERLDAAPDPAEAIDTATPEPVATAEPDSGPSYISRDSERRVLISLMQDPNQLRAGGLTSALEPQDFTQTEHTYLFKALQNLHPDEAMDPWVLANQAQRLARQEGAELSHSEVQNIGYAARTLRVPPAEQTADHLVTMTVRRTARDASTAMETAAHNPSTRPRQLINQAHAQLQQATHEALRHHEQSVPNPSRYAGHQAHL
ncbi:DnaB-like helicase N-terminal domain-containing protein [Streptomyces sp. NPDC058861]|uniref:DnaB-like helicase N-terminal domain-containing protein n=1 Tax=Streptomyces sp. NPDC058861 TaxID=3346653 RepID=UPI0036B8C6CC